MSSAGRAQRRSRAGQLRSACPPARSASSREVLVNATECPRRQAWCPSAWATIVSHPDGAVQDHRLAGLEEAQARQVADEPSRDLGVEAEVELLERDGGLEARGSHSADQRRGLPARDLVLAQRLQELQVPELTRPGLGEPGLEGVEHAG